MIQEKEILNTLKQIIDPDFNRDIVSLGFVKNIRIKDSQASCLPCAAEVNPEVPVVRDRVANPVGPGATLHDDDNVAAVVEVSHRDATSSTRLMADCFDHERVSSIVRRARNTGQEGNVRDRVRDTDNEVGKVHM